MTVVYFTDGVTNNDKRQYESVTIKASGWAFCYREDDTVDAYPPHKIDRIADPNRGDKHRGEKLTGESPHGRV